MRLVHLFSFAAVALLPLGLVPAALATTITAGSTAVVANGGVAPGSATNYAFFGGKPGVLTDYTLSTSGDNSFGGLSTYTSVTAPDGTGPFTTGIAYDGSCACAQTSQLATFSTLSDGNFDVFVLDANTDGLAVGNSSVGLGVNGGAAATTASLYYSGTSEYTEFVVTGATTGDVFQLYATGATVGSPNYTGNSANYPSLGGVTFSNISSAAATPEPSSMCLLGTGLLSIAGVVRRKLRK